MKFKLTKFIVIDNTVLLKMNLPRKPRYNISTMTHSVEFVMPKLLHAL